jgi:outer membrane protein assembly factor BamA
MYVQANLSWVSSETSTPMSVTTPNSDNDYLTCGVNIGYAIDDRTDVTASYNYYGSSDYNVAAASMGYGLDTEEHAFSLTLSRMITENMMWNLSYGYITSNTSGNDQSGGFNDFDAHMISTGLQIRF